MQYLITFLTSAAGAALIAGLFGVIQYRMKRADDNNDKKNAERKALRYLMLFIIEERCKEHIANGEISLEALRLLHHWHDVYHNGLGGNGDADDLMHRVENLKIITD